MKIKIAQQIKVMIANVNKVPPSLLTSIPNFVTCDKIAPAIVPNPKIAPNKVVLGIKIKIEAINSTIPEPILP